MTRSRLTATEILHGARAYGYNASRRAHQLSGPKRVRVMHGPVSGHANAGMVEIAARLEGVKCAGCGFMLCKTTVKCRPPKAVAPIPAPPGERDPYEAAGHPRARVGMKVKHAPGVAYQDSAVRTVIVSPLECFDYRNNVHTNWGWAETARYIPAPIAEAPAAESDEAVLRRCGWSGRPGASFLDYYLADGTALWVSQLGASPSWFRSGGDGETHNAPTLLQAACAALGITLEIEDPGGSEFFSDCYRAIAPNAGEYEGALVTATGDRIRDIETAARAALLAYASRGKP
jgi:hypothetical protein